MFNIHNIRTYTCACNSSTHYYTNNLFSESFFPGCIRSQLLNLKYLPPSSPQPAAATLSPLSPPLLLYVYSNLINRNLNSASPILSSDTVVICTLCSQSCTLYTYCGVHFTTCVPLLNVTKSLILCVQEMLMTPSPPQF